MHLGPSSVGRFRYTRVLLTTALLTIIIIIGNPSRLQAQAGISFYSSNTPPTGMGSLQPLIAKWWDFDSNQPSRIHNSWPICLKGDVTIGNRSIVFLGDPASAPVGDVNLNATHQVCQISSSQLLHLIVYSGFCSQSDSPGKSIPQLLACAQDTNKIIKLMKATVDDVDVTSNIIHATSSQPFILSVHSQDNAFAEKLNPTCCGEAMAENYFLLFKHIPVGHHTITAEVIRVPLQANQPVEHDLAKWNINVVR